MNINMSLKLSVDQVATAILLLDVKEKQELWARLPTLLTLTPDASEELEWLYIAESGFQFWEDPAEDLYNDLIPTTESEA